jgi:hypothetical protein
MLVLLTLLVQLHSTITYTTAAATTITTGALGGGAGGARVARGGGAFSSCGSCASVMDMKVTPEGRPLLFCTECDRGLPLPQTGEIVKKQPAFACPLCQFDVLEVRFELLLG